MIVAPCRKNIKKFNSFYYKELKKCKKIKNIFLVFFIIFLALHQIRVIQKINSKIIFFTKIGIFYFVIIYEVKFF